MNICTACGAQIEGDRCLRCADRSQSRLEPLLSPALTQEQAEAFVAAVEASWHPWRTSMKGRS